MKRIVFAVCLLALCRNVDAATIIGNSVQAPYQNGTNFGTKSVGFETGLVRLLLEKITVALGTHDSCGGTLTFTLNADAGNQPGGVLAIIGSQTLTGCFGPTAAYPITPASPLVLDPQTKYWIQVAFPAGSPPAWDRTDPSTAPSSGLAAFIGYWFDSGSGGGPSSTFNAITVEGRTAPDESSGTAGRTILTGSRFGFAISPIDNLNGGFGVDTTSESIHGATDEFGWSVGWCLAGGILPPSGPRAAAYVNTADSAFRGRGFGGARGIAYAEYRSDGGPVLPRAKAVLEGEFLGNPGHVTAAVYVLDKSLFLDALRNSHQSLPDFLLSADTLDKYERALESELTLTRLFPVPGTVIVEKFVKVDPSTSLPVEVDAGTFLPLPGQSVIVVFDISAYAPPGATVHFASTLKPSADFMTGMTAVGPWTPVPPAAASLAITPATTTSAITMPVTVTAAARTAGGAPVPNTLVFLEITAGPNAQPLGPTMTDAQGRVTFTYTGGANAGTDQIRASIGSLQSNFAEVTWTLPGPLDHIAISPASATIQAGATQTYSALALDLFNNSVGDVTANTTFTIAPDGSCTGATCTASIPGTHTVTATNNGKSATATLEITGVASTFAFSGFFDPIEMSALEPVWNTLRAGQSVPFKWLLTLNGAPVSDPASFGELTTIPVVCPGAGSIEDAIEQTGGGTSGLQYNGGGYWQFNWETPKSFRSSCRAVVVRFSDGTSSPPALFKFK
jgi:hypothetical protein